MDNRISSAFDEVRAEQELKASTKYFLYEKYNSVAEQKQQKLKKNSLVILSAVFILVLCTGILTYSVPVSAISLDTEEASVELSINCFDKVVKVDCYGNASFYEDINFRNLSYNEAVSIIMENEKETAPILTISCKNSSRCKTIADEIGKLDATQECHTNSNFSSDAKKHGISNGKYNAFLTLKEYEPELTVEEAKALTMKEIHERIRCHANSQEITEEKNCTSDTTAHSHGHTGNGHNGHGR